MFQYVLIINNKIKISKNKLNYLILILNQIRLFNHNTKKWNNYD